MQHIKRIDDNTYHVTIGERVLEAVCKYNTAPVTKMAVERFLVGNPAPNCRVSDITERARIEAESILLQVSKDLGCRGVERYNEAVIYLRHAFGLIAASWSRQHHNWTVSTEHDVYVCEPDAVSVRKALVFLLDDSANKEDGGGVAAAFIFGATGLCVGALVGYFFL
jgi:hypothetical protein